MSPVPLVGGLFGECSRSSSVSPLYVVLEVGFISKKLTDDPYKETLFLLRNVAMAASDMDPDGARQLRTAVHLIFFIIFF